jgi:hypothetical protein
VVLQLFQLLCYLARTTTTKRRRIVVDKRNLECHDLDIKRNLFKLKHITNSWLADTPRNDLTNRVYVALTSIFALIVQ